MASVTRPNILLITTDQQHFDTIGLRNPRIKTPAFDRLAGEGALFDRAYCNNPVCSPSRSTIITGLYPAWHHCWTIGVKLPEDVPTVGDLLQDAGYATMLVGKAHFQPLASTPESTSIECQPVLRDLDFWRRFQGPWYGFGHVETARMHADESHCGQHYAIWMEENGLANWRDYFIDWPEDRSIPRRRHSWELPQQFHHTTWVGQRTIANIEEAVAQDKPFFLWSSFFDPHPQYLVSEPWAGMYQPEDMIPGRLADGELELLPPHFGKTQQQRPDFSMYDEPGGQHTHGFNSHLIDEQLLRTNMAVYYGMVSFIDQQVGHMLDALERLGIAENTIVIFTTDHGHFLGQHGLIAKGPFHFEDMIKLPMIVRYPARVSAGRTVSALQSQVDFAPTFLAAAGVDVPGYMQGFDQMPTWSGNSESVRDHIIVENRHQPTTVHVRSYVDQRYKITVYRNHDYGEMFDLEQDPNEVRNLWNDPAHAQLKATLLHRFVQAEIQREPTRMPRVANA